MQWNKNEVTSFIESELNFYGWGPSTSEETKTEVSIWKYWLWLERHGFDFAYESLEAQIVQFRVSEELAGVSFQEERQLLVKIRDLMREVLGLSPLDAEARAALQSTIWISNWSHWAAVGRPYGSDVADLEADYSYVVAHVWNFIENDKPDYIRVMRELMASDDLTPDVYDDGFSLNGKYHLALNREQKLEICRIITGFHVTKVYDMVFSPGNLKLNHHIARTFVDSVEEYLSKGIK